MAAKCSRIIIIALLLLACSFQCEAQRISDPPQPARRIINRKNAVIAGLVLQQAGSFYLEYKWWWEGKGHPFVVATDGWFDNYSKGIDKIGHLYTSYFYFHLLNDVMKWGGFGNTACITSAIVFPAAYALSVELGDGFSSYNFSFDDLAANFTGIAYGLAQVKFPWLRNFNLKFSYFPSQHHFDSSFRNWSLTEDYDGHIYWLSMNVHNLLPGRASRFWPEPLALAVGYGVQGFGTAPTLQREFFIGLDYNLGAIRSKNSTIQTMLQILDKFHYPAPGFKKTGDQKMAPELLLLN